MASILKVDDLRGNTTANDITVTVGASATQKLHDGIAKMLCHYDQSSTVAIVDSLNVASLTDTATAKTEINYTNNFSSVAYFNAGQTFTVGNVMIEDNPSTNKVHIITKRIDTAAVNDYDNVNELGFGDLA
jgi:hypothetical protein